MKHVEKGWGWERWICNGPEYCGKLLFFNKGKRCSWHVHRLKDEVFYLQSGKMIVYYSDDDDITKGRQLILNPGDNFHVYRGLRHQMVALEDSELFELLELRLFDFLLSFFSFLSLLFDFFTLSFTFFDS